MRSCAQCGTPGVLAMCSLFTGRPRLRRFNRLFSGSGTAWSAANTSSTQGASASSLRFRFLRLCCALPIGAVHHGREARQLRVPDPVGDLPLVPARCQPLCVGIHRSSAAVPSVLEVLLGSCRLPQSDDDGEVSTVQDGRRERRWQVRQAFPHERAAVDGRSGG